MNTVRRRADQRCSVWSMAVPMAAIALGSGMISARAADCEGDILRWAAAPAAAPMPPPRSLPELPAPPRPATPADTTVAPFALTGRFLSVVGPDNRFCTAQFVGGNDILLTAAHCVRHKDGTWLERFEFTPSNGGPAVTSALCFATPANWVSGAASNWFYPADYAFIRLSSPAATDHLALAQAPAASPRATTIGFPLQIEFGQRLYQAVGPFERGGWPTPVPAGQEIGVIEHQEPRFGLGISGGGWFGETVAGQRHGVFGLNATGTDGGSAGPAFGACAARLLDLIITRCPAH